MPIRVSGISRSLPEGNSLQRPSFLLCFYHAINNNQNSVMNRRFPHPRKYKNAFGQLPAPQVAPLSKRHENIIQILTPESLKSTTSRRAPPTKQPIVSSEEEPDCNFYQELFASDTRLSSLQEQFEQFRFGCIAELETHTQIEEQISWGSRGF